MRGARDGGGFLVLVLLSLVRPIACAKTPLEDCVAACQLSLRPFVFPDTPPDVPAHQRVCVSRLHITSLYVCSRRYCPSHVVQPGLDQLNETCTQQTRPLPPFNSIVDNITSDKEERYRRLNRSNYETGSELVLEGPAMPARDLFDDARRTVVCFDRPVTWHMRRAIELTRCCRVRTALKWPPATSMRKGLPLYLGISVSLTNAYSAGLSCSFFGVWPSWSGWGFVCSIL